MKSIFTALVLTLIFSLNTQTAFAYENANEPYTESESESCTGYGCDDGARYHEEEGPEYSYEDPRYEDSGSYEEGSEDSNY